MKNTKLLLLIGLLGLIIVGAWAVETQNQSLQTQPQDFRPDDPSDYPDLNRIDLTIIGITNIGELHMLEGIENWTTSEQGGAMYSRLVIHGIFHRTMRNWRDDVIKGSFNKRDFRLDLYNSRNSRVLRITFYNCFPVKYSLPPLSVESSTRYLERMEFDYDYFEISN